MGRALLLAVGGPDSVRGTKTRPVPVRKFAVQAHTHTLPSLSTASKFFFITVQALGQSGKGRKEKRQKYELKEL